ncbi:MAG: amino acid adenylation domain-containing protein [Desulfobacterales bacterium]|nr:amino acid adenylation domain-containing protein [Desulfobacterales bacterium]
MKIEAFLKDLSLKEIKIWVQNGKLKYKGLKEQVNIEVIETLRLYKADIIQYLKERSEDREPFPLSYGQQALWYQYQIAPESSAYNLSGLFHLHPDLDINLLQKSLNILFRRHSTLRTIYFVKDTKPAQSIQNIKELKMEIIDITSWTTHDVNQWYEKEGDRPFDLEKGPLIRTSLLCRALNEPEYIFFLAAHHIACDFWSIDIFFKELSLLYESAQKGKNLDLSDISLQYKDYIEWQDAMLKGKSGEELSSYWLKHLKLPLPVLNLACDHPRPRIKTFTGDSKPFAIDMALSARIRQLAKSFETTPFVIFLTSFYTLLHRYTGNEDILVGSATAGRNLIQFKQIHGLFANQVVLRAYVSGNPTVYEMILRTKQIVLSAIKYQDYPFYKLLEDLKPFYDPSLSPIFQVAFDWEQARLSKDLKTSEEGEISSEKLIWKVLHSEQRGGAYDLNVRMQSREGIYEGKWQYARELFKPETISRMIGHFQMLLKGMVENPGQKVSDLIMLTEKEVQILYKWNDTYVDYPKDQTVVDLLEAQVRLSPDAIAVVCGGDSLTYRVLHEKANQLAHYLIDLGVLPDALVGICVERSLEMIIGLLGILKAGGAYVPIDLHYPKERIYFMLKDADVSILLTQKSIEQLFMGTNCHAICMDSIWDKISEYPSSSPGKVAFTQNLAYVIYTSGSTGLPKGAMNRHRGVYNRLRWMQDAYQLRANDAVLQKTPISFDVSVWEFFWPLITGAKLVFAKPEGHKEIYYLADLIEQQAITTMHFVPSMLQVFLQELEDPCKCTSLSRVICSGETLGFELEQMFFKLFAQFGTNLYNLYGPTEASIDVTSYHCKPENPYGFVPIGKPISNTKIYILDACLNHLPVGVMGEIYIGGEGLARGYINNEELTKERFIQTMINGLTSEPVRIYKTGDLGRFLTDGNIEYIGRIDDQIKLRGFRIELKEIESLLLKHPNVKESVVILNDEFEKLIAYVTLHAKRLDDRFNNYALKDYLKTYLPDYMIPASIIVVDAMPLSPNGKIDKKRLPQLKNLIEEISDSSTPSSKTKELLLILWKDLFKKEEISVNNNFFNIGGHSLLATKLVSRIRKVFGIDISLKEVFLSPVLSDLANVIDSIQNKWKYPPISPIDKSGRLPLSHAQTRLWFLAQLEGMQLLYNMPATLRLEGLLDKDALDHALFHLTTRHDSLRMCFECDDGTPYVRLCDPYHPLEVVNLSHLSKEMRINEIKRLSFLHANTLFDLTKGFLFKVKLLQLEKDEHIILCNMHHIISDGWSVGILIKELSVAYSQMADHQAIRLPDLSVQYQDYSYWQQSHLLKERFDIELKYWINQLKDAPRYLPLPTDRIRPVRLSYKGNHIPVHIPYELTQKIKIFSQNQGLTLFMTLFSAFNVLLYRYSGEEDILIGTPIANRNHHQTEDVIGFFVNTLILRTSIEGRDTFINLVSRVRKTCMDAYCHQDIPFEQLVDHLKVDRSLSYSPLFQVMFELQNQDTPKIHLKDLKIYPQETNYPISKFDLTLSLEETSQGIAGTIEYCRDLFDEKTIRRMSAHFTLLMEAIMEHPDLAIGTLPMLTPDEIQLINTVNDTNVPFMKDQTVVDLFETQFRLKPDSAAVVYGDDKLTYHTLNEKANQLAHYLIDLGVTNETRVGICVKRSLGMIVALLGILKAGGVYVPIDPNYPKERIFFIIKDANISILINEENIELGLNYHLVKTIRIDSDWGSISKYSADSTGKKSLYNHLAYIIYTSGSTGSPKGVMIEHRSLSNAYFAWEEAYNLKEIQVHLQMANFTFDVFTGDLIRALCSGGKLVICPASFLFDPESLYWLIHREKVEFAEFVPAVFRNMMQYLEESNLRLNSLKVLCFGSDMSYAKEFRKIRILCNPETNLINSYGVTEAAIDTCYFKFSDSEYLEGDRLLPIGKPFANMQCYVLNSHLELNPIGIAGELHIGGAGLSRGYLNNPELTLEKFISNPFSNESGGRLYKTGDLVRLLPSGNIECIGRIDDQVKLRGFRIELKEIEELLLKHPNIKESVVVLHQNIDKTTENDDIRSLAAYVTLRTDKSADSLKDLEISATLKGYLKTYLPDYMIPEFIISVDAIPLLPNGKIDKKRLPQPTRNISSHFLKIPRNSTELMLKSIWEELLGIHPIGIYDNFFDIGGQSLLAIRLISRINQYFKKPLTVTMLFQYPNIAGLSECLSQDPRVASYSSLIPIQTKGSNPPLFIVPGAGGFAFYLNALSSYLGKNQPLYGLQDPGLDIDIEPYQRIEDIAHHHIQHIKQIKSKGPYILGGHSFGGYVAYEIAQQLQRSGDDVSCVILFDTFPPGFEDESPSQIFDDIDWLLSFIQLTENLFDVSLNIFRDDLKLLTDNQQIAYIEKKLYDNHVFPIGSSAIFHKIFKVYKANCQTRYKPSDVIPTRLAFFRPSEAEKMINTSDLYHDPLLDWKGYSNGKIEIFYVAGNHISMLNDPHVKLLAELLEKFIKQFIPVAEKGL